MSENTAVEMKKTVGLTGLTMNAMALIAPGAFLWLTFFILLIIVLGGLGNNLGAVVMTVAFVALREGLRFVRLPVWLNAAALQQLVFGVLLIIATIFVPRGLIPERKVTYRRENSRAESRPTDQRLR
jgi:ABC-type branched-subunit amino acid transport system permease subunit